MLYSRILLLGQNFLLVDLRDFFSDLGGGGGGGSTKQITIKVGG